MSLALLLSSCSAAPITWHMVSAPELREQAVRAGLPPDVEAFALRRPGGCTIWSGEPETWQALLEIYWHERRHCWDGAFH